MKHAFDCSVIVLSAKVKIKATGMITKGQAKSSVQTRRKAAHGGMCCNLTPQGPRTQVSAGSHGYNSRPSLKKEELQRHN